MQKQEFLNSQYFNQILDSSNISFFYTWCEKQQKWIQDKSIIHKWQQSKSNLTSDENYFRQHIVNPVNKIKSVTLNVLFDFRSSEEPDNDRGHMKFSTQRYNSILDQLGVMECDVITLNEVTRPLVKLIEQRQWVRKHYRVSTCHDSPYGKDGIRCFGNIILTKLLPLALHVYKISSTPRAIPIGFFAFPSAANNDQNNNERSFSIVTFSSIHLTANDKNFQRRERELTELNKYLNKFNSCVDQHILQGDMNFHSQKENINASKNHLQDCWLEVNQIKNDKDLEQNPGYTFDSTNNYFIKELYWGFEKRQMRLDRIFLSKHKKNFIVPKQMKVIFNKPIHEEIAQNPSLNIVKSVLTFLGDKAKINLFRNRQKYLFCSDHFGLQCIFEVDY